MFLLGASRAIGQTLPRLSTYSEKGQFIELLDCVASGGRPSHWGADCVERAADGGGQGSLDRIKVEGGEGK